jgi:hypothetical protein
MDLEDDKTPLEQLGIIIPRELLRALSSARFCFGGTIPFCPLCRSCSSRLAVRDSGNDCVYFRGNRCSPHA